MEGFITRENHSRMLVKHAIDNFISLDAREKNKESEL